ncbi:hypothetical protein PI124_g6085 [Phytophthora idaei]|nr:hypothetical protein PI125_g5153 [Phytophthora idaei]KAG3249238.1 hypothetical protein PI124_g6085 [Phytophthora idaei]
MAPSTETKVKLVSMDGEAFEVDTSVAVISELVKTLVADDEEEGGEDAPMAEIQKPLKNNVLTEAVDEWDAKFVDLEDQELLFVLILAANYMDIKSLLDLSCAKVACMIKGKTPEEIRATFGITEEFTEEEQQRILGENKWIEDV